MEWIKNGSAGRDGMRSEHNTGGAKDKRKEWGGDVPRTAAWGKLMIGVPYKDPNTPPLELRYDMEVSFIHAVEFRGRDSLHGEGATSHIL